MALNKILTAKDHLLSNEEFDIIPYKKGILKTEPFPEDLSTYYESEDYISHTDERNNLLDTIYGWVKSYMLSQKRKWVLTEKSKGKILDIGAGTGDFLNQFKNQNWEICGVEPNRKAREFALKKGLNLVQELNDVKPKNFDIISLWHVLEHIPNLEEQILKIYSLLDKNGILIIAVPNYKSYDAQYYKEDWAAWDVPRHLWHFSQEGLKMEMKNLGFECFQNKPLIFDSYYVSLLSENFRKNGGSKLNAFKTGFKSNFKAKTSGEYSSLTYFFRKS
ncbi:class I SAM-dependent methyltransferase [Gramella sp. AN32]|uniref:Class I SAM-dependent methyltransferase n=1 Tax=Christiangramia antarctica TaxID=2058158 RepID=A0ABW5X2P8_9FLAO|nr:class I SAM-dependent methyltransferase [Gramella sp. AN32]MCM4155007.1 methyltransferase [Gramella sp. AN32]